VNLTIDQDRLLSEIEALAQISEAEPPAVTRVVFTPTDLKGTHIGCAKNVWSKNLAVRQDAIGNMFARWTGTDETAAPVATGSHIDAIPNAGKYDGVVGVLGGLEAIAHCNTVGFGQRVPLS